MLYKTEDLITSAKRSEFFPVSQNTFTDPGDLIAFANEEYATKLLPFMLTNRQDFFLNNKYTSIINNLNHYALPSRAAGNSFKDLFYLPDANNLGYKYTIPKIEVHEIAKYSFLSGVPIGFHMQGDEVVLLPTPNSSTGLLQFYYFRRPSTLVPTTSCTKITAISNVGGTATFTVDTDLTSSLSVGSLVDFQAMTSPSLPWADDVAVTAITSTSIAVAASAITNEGSILEPIVGDYICPAGQSLLPQGLPQEFHPILAEMICFRVLKALKDANGMASCSSNITDQLKLAFKLIENRIESEVDTISDLNSILNAVSYSSYRFSTTR